MTPSSPSLETSRSQDPPSDDDDDELLALRIAALESIKIKEARAAKEQSAKAKPGFLIQSHPARNNLVSIVTNEEDIDSVTKPKTRPSPPAPAKLVPVFDPSRPPPGCFAAPPQLPGDLPLLPFPPPARYSRSPRRWSRSPPSRRSPSPYRSASYSFSS